MANKRPVSRARRLPGATCSYVLGEHPPDDHPLGVFLSAEDGSTQSEVPHRMLKESKDQRSAIIEYLRESLIRHHISPEALKRKHEAMARQGYKACSPSTRHFPTNLITQKGNLAEVVLAEYLNASSNISLPVYRLRYNPNVEQSMKGDDVLAFDLDSRPVRIIVGEAKFRSTPSKAVVTEIVEALTRSYKSGIPVSLQFVADRLFDSGEVSLGERVQDCAMLFAQDMIDINYVGLLMSNTRAADMFNRHADNSLRRLVVISFGLDKPGGIINPCYRGLDEQS